MIFMVKLTSYDVAAHYPTHHGLLMGTFAVITDFTSQEIPGYCCLLLHGLIQLLRLKNLCILLGYVFRNAENVTFIIITL